MSGTKGIQAAYDALKASYEELFSDHSGLKVMHKAIEEALARTANNRDMWQAQCRMQAEELRRLREPGPDEPDPDQLREDRVERQRLAKEYPDVE